MASFRKPSWTGPRSPTCSDEVHSLALVAAAGLALAAVGTVFVLLGPPGQQGRLPRARPHGRALVPRLRRDRALAPAGQPHRLPARHGLVLLVPRGGDRVEQRLGLHARAARQLRPRRLRPRAARVPDRAAPGPPRPMARRGHLRARLRRQRGAAAGRRAARLRLPRVQGTIAVTTSDTAHSSCEPSSACSRSRSSWVVLAIVVARFLRAQGALRRALGPVLGTGAVVMGVLLVSLVVEAFSTARPSRSTTSSSSPSRSCRWRSSRACCAAGSRVRASATCSSTWRAVRRSATRSRALADPTLEVAYWHPRRDAMPRPTGSAAAERRPAPHLPGRARGPPDGGAVPTPCSPTSGSSSSRSARPRSGSTTSACRKLRAQYEFLETIVNAAPSLLCSLDREGRIANLNEASRRVSGYPDEEDVRWQPFWDVYVAPEERDEARYRFEAAAPTTRPVRSSTRSSTNWARR